MACEFQGNFVCVCIISMTKIAKFRVTEFSGGFRICQREGGFLFLQITDSKKSGDLFLGGFFRSQKAD